MSEGTGNWNDLRGKRASVPAHVVFRAFAHETVVLNIRTGRYYGVDAIGGRFLEVLSDAPDLAAASTALAAQYGQPLERIQRDLAAFVHALTSRGLLELEGPVG